MLTKKFNFHKNNLSNKSTNKYFFNSQFITVLNKKRQNKDSKSQYYIKNIDYNRKILNKNIESLYNNYKNKIGFNNTHNILNPVWIKNESYWNISLPTMVIKKENLLHTLNKKRQFFFLLKEFNQSLYNHNIFLIKENTNIKYKLLNLLQTKYYSIEENQLQIFYSRYLSSIVFNNFYQEKINLSSIIFSENLTKISSYLTNQIFYYLNNTSEIKSSFNLLFLLKNNYILQLINLTKNLNINTSGNTAWNDLINNKNGIESLYSNKKLTNFKKLRATFSVRYFVKTFENSFSRNKYNHISFWKKNNSLFHKKNLSLKKPGNKHFFVLPNNRLIQNSKNNYFLIKRKQNRFINMSHILYLLTRLEEKIDLYNQNENGKEIALELTKLYNFFKIQLDKKNINQIQTGLILSNLNEILKVKKSDWKKIFIVALNKWISDNLVNSSNNKAIEEFFNKLQKKLTTFRKKKQIRKISSKQKELNFSSIFSFGINKKKNFFSFNQKPKKYLNNRLNIRKQLNDEKVVIKNNYMNINQAKEALSLLTNKKVKIFFVNALALTKYAFNLERNLEKKEKRSPTTFLQNIDRDMINKYKYVGIYIKDLIRVCFIGMFLKKASFMAKFIAFQLNKLPRNRKETSFIRFIVKVVKTFAAEREEILGLRIKFKGRVNRWRRTKSITGERGVIPLHTFNNRIECGSAHAINRKGTLGIRIWIRYKPSFSMLIKDSFLKYFAYSKKLTVKKTLPRLIYFTHKNN